MLRKCDLFSKQYFLSSETRFHGSLTRWEIAALEERLVRGGGGGGGGGEGGGEAALSHAVDRHEGPPPPPPPHIRIREIQFKDFRGFYWESKKYKILRRASFLSNIVDRQEGPPLTGSCCHICVSFYHFWIIPQSWAFFGLVFRIDMWVAYSVYMFTHIFEIWLNDTVKR